MAQGATPKSCKHCVFYIKNTGYCLKLGKYIQNPNDPPCRASTNSIVANAKNHQQPQPTAPPTNPVVSIPRVQSIAPPSLNAPTLPPRASVVNVVHNTMPGQLQATLPSAAPPPQPPPPEDLRLHFTSTGIPMLDEILGGGFLRGKTYLVAGETGCGKTIFSIQFLLHGAYIGEPGIYIAIDEPTEQLIKGLKRFGWDVTPLVRSGKLVFLDMRTHFSKIYLKEERRKMEPRFIIESILQTAKKVKAKRLVIDPIAPLIYGGTPDDVLYAREFLREMVFAIERIGTITTIMTSEIPTGSNQLSRFGVEEFLASGIIVLGLMEINGNIERVMYIRKARWAPVKPSKYVFDIVPSMGIVIRGPLSKFIRSPLRQ